MPTIMLRVRRLARAELIKVPIQSSARRGTDETFAVSIEDWFESIDRGWKRITSGITSGPRGWPTSLRCERRFPCVHIYGQSFGRRSISAIISRTLLKRSATCFAQHIAKDCIEFRWYVGIALMDGGEDLCVGSLLSIRLSIFPRRVFLPESNSYRMTPRARYRTPIEPFIATENCSGDM